MWLITIQTPGGYRPLKGYSHLEKALLYVASKYQTHIPFEVLKRYRVWYLEHDNINFDYLAQDTCNYIYFIHGLNYVDSISGDVTRVSKKSLHLLKSVRYETLVIQIRDYFDIIVALNNTNTKTIKGLYDKIFNDRRFYYSREKMVKRISYYHFQKIDVKF